MAVSLVTGGAGFIGSHVVDQLVQRGDEVIVLDDLSGGFEQNINPGAEFVLGSITNDSLIKRLFERRIDYVYHLAAYAAEGLSHFIKRFNFENNVIGSINLINASVNSGVKCFVFTSSIAVYGENELPMREELIPNPEDSYGIAKYAVELELRSSKRMFDLNYVIFRPHNVYGERQNIGDKYRNVLGIFMNQIMRGEPLTIFGNGEQTRAFSYIADVAPHIARAPELTAAYGEVFNVGADSPYSVNQLADEVMRAFGADVPVRHLEARNEVVHAYCSHEKFRRVFGVDHETPLANGIGCMAEWAQAVGPRASQPFGNIEIQKNLPPSWR
jgi:UDP-glucose 4-epimerase